MYQGQFSENARTMVSQCGIWVIKKECQIWLIFYSIGPCITKAREALCIDYSGWQMDYALL